MPGSRLEAAVSSLVTRARLYERIAHDARPWTAWIRSADCSMAIDLARHEHNDRIVLTGYLRTPLRGITAVEIWSGDFMAVCRIIDPPQDGPVRVCFALEIEDSELAA
jgi:hypothetical protein